MTLSLDPTTFIFYLALFFLAWYAVGNFVNMRRLRKVSTGLANALKTVGGAVNYRRSGPSTAILSGKNLLGVMPEYSVAVGVLSVANPLTWLSSRLGGRGDLAVLRAKLKVEPPFEVTLVKKGTPPHRYSRRQKTKPEEVGEFLLLRRESTPSAEAVERLLRPLHASKGIWMLTLSKRIPHLQAYIALKGSAEYFGNDLRSLGKTLSSL